ncbi:TauD/TfdA dioxygenase family protein [Novosphingobium sp. Leaf2]|uniref:TauD/TfdA dioxygenase family protein n=1 Tax=Novosphingobium sp. Leaf2 TaxID=1735670 RepID=UPI000700694C|nr:TauD/TfdA family dioxygenase [Novosphingobium sp. Leaf2]KQM14746.1 taurine dioxygenase [Novosphingobium sp. Leaf2]
MSTASLDRAELKPGFGTQIGGVDLAAAGDAQLADIVAEFHRTGALVLRWQSLTPEQFVRFGKAFGPLEGHTLQDFTLPDHPEIYILSNRVEDGRPVGAHNDGIGWHTDLNYTAEPAMCTMLYAIAVPPEGSDTLLADQCAAFAALPAQRQAELARLKQIHSFEYLANMRSEGRKAIPPEVLRANPDVVHPLVRTHPADGRKALWVSSLTPGFVGWSTAESEPVIDALIAFVTQERFVYRHKWQVGDVLVWDNRCTLHTGTLFDDTRYIREMHRMWVKGDRPY